LRTLLAYFWIVPAKVEGRWKLASGELELLQSFQMVSGSLKAGAETLAIRDGRLVGTRLSFSAGGTDYIGIINGNKIEGISRSPGGDADWSATALE
jgi:hypothetical protein